MLWRKSSGMAVKGPALELEGLDDQLIWLLLIKGLEWQKSQQINCEDLMLYSDSHVRINAFLCFPADKYQHQGQQMSMTTTNLHNQN